MLSCFVAQHGLSSDWAWRFSLQPLLQELPQQEGAEVPRRSAPGQIPVLVPVLPQGHTGQRVSKATYFQAHGRGGFPVYWVSFGLRQREELEGTPTGVRYDAAEGRRGRYGWRTCPWYYCCGESE